MSTKKLAKELGIIRKRSQNKESGQTKRPGKKQYFSYLIIIDFESTCWREKNNYGQEIIEFPAVLLNTSTGAVESEFHTYVQPQEHPSLSEFCTELTGITQAQVEAGVPLAICLSRFTRWLHSLQQERGVVFVRDGKAPLAPGCPCAFVTWSDWDLGVCLLYECKRKQICKPEALNSWIDLRATYKLFYNRKPKGLNGALQDLGIEFSGREHSGLDDARNTARLAWRMMTDGCFMKITKSLDRTPLRAKPLFPNKPVDNDPSNHREHSSHDNMQEGVSKQQQQHRSDSTPLEISAKPPPDVPLDTTHRVCQSGLNVNQNPGAYQCQSLVTPKTVLGSLSSCLSVGGMTGPMMGRHGSYGALSRSSLLPRATGLVLVSTTVSSHTDELAKQLNFDLEASEVDWTDGVVLPDTEESGPSYDDVVLEEEGQKLGDWCGPEIATNSGVCRKGPWKTALSSASSSLLLPPAPSDSLVASSANRISLPVVKNRPRATSDDACFKMPRPVSAPTDNYRSVLRPFVHKTTPSGSVAHSSIYTPTTPSFSATNSNPHYTNLGSLVSKHSLLNSATPCSSAPRYVAPKTTAPSSGSALPSPLYQSHTPHSGHTVQRCSSKTTTPSTPFTIFQDVESQPSTSNRTTKTSTGGSFSVPPSVLSSSVNQSFLPASSRTGAPRKAAAATTMTTVTSPLCGCGRRAKRLSVGNGGPNHGRGFYCCPVRRSGPGVAAAKKGCEFFKWESALLASLTPGPSKQRHASCPPRPAPALPKLLR